MDESSLDAGLSNFNSREWSVLLVDDEPTQRLITGRLLKRAGFQVSTAQDGSDALQALVTSVEYHLVITDWEMPNMDGIDLCRAIRKLNRDGYLYVILLTSRDAIEHLIEGLQAGADDYLTKPVLEPELLARLNTGKRIVNLERNLRAANEENRRLSYKHPVTEVFNRRYLMEQLQKEITDAVHADGPLSLVMCDVDNFKSVNDRYGHIVGSRVLVAVANFLNLKAIEAGGWLAHHGGDEFSIIVPGLSLNSAGQYADMVRSALAKEYLLKDLPKFTVTASFGVAGWNRAVPLHSKLDPLLSLADACVYRSKDSGRNRVTVDSLDLKHEPLR